MKLSFPFARASLAPFLCLAAALSLLPSAAFSAEPAASPAPATQPIPPARLRGFNVPSLNPDLLRDAKEKFGANSVRYLLPLNWKVNVDHVSDAEALKRLVADLPAGLDAARDLGLTVIISMPMLDLVKTSPNDPKKVPYWKDEGHLQQFLDVWTEIAKMCADRPQEIWFDIVNEPLDRSVMPFAPKQWPAWAQKITDAIRAIDPHHPIVVECGPGGLCWGMWTMPILKGDPIIYSFHQYQPQSYTHQGIADVKHTDLSKAFLESGRPWPGEFGDSGGGLWDKERLPKELEPVLAFHKKHPEARIYVGEFSVVRWAPNGAQYLRDNLELFEKYGWDWSYHAFREHNFWSLEHHPDGTKVDELTDRGQVVHEFMERNNQGAVTKQ